MHPEDATLMKQAIAGSLSVLVEKPLHVRVAEALGWTSLRNVGNCMIPGEPDDYIGRPPGNLFVGPGGESPVLRYDIWWSATGPLIERFRIAIDAPEKHCDQPSKHTCMQWNATGPDYDRAPSGEWAVHMAAGGTPLLAVCNLILSLKGAGKL